MWGPCGEAGGRGRTRGEQDRQGLPRGRALEGKGPTHSQIFGFGKKLGLTQAFDSQFLPFAAMTWPLRLLDY